MTKQEREINELIALAEDLAEKTRALYRDLYQHDPRKEIENPPSLVTLAADARQIAYRAAELGDEIKKVYEKR